MGEVDTKPIESVQTALSFFGQITDHDKKKDSLVNDQRELDKEKDLESLMKDLASIKLQLDAKDSAYNQVLLKLDHHREITNELSTLLINSDFQKDYYINEFREAKLQIGSLESAMKQMAHQLSESENVKEQLLLVTSDLASTQAQLSQIQREKANALSEKEAELETMHDEVENMKKELEIAMSKLMEFRTRAEQAISRAEAAEKGKKYLEDLMKRRKEDHERRKAALIALREESTSADFSTSNIIKYEAPSKNYQPLGKVLNMKF